jgi:hypothetical protein
MEMSRRWIVASVLAAALAAPALADRPFPPVENATVLSECGDCHMAYQPRMLPQRSWQKLMDGIGDHFGEELSLDEGARREVLDYLLQGAADAGGKKKRKGHRFMRGLGPREAPIRITETPHWRKEHHELPDRVWSDEKIESRGDCEACHTKASQGRYDDDDGLRVPGRDGSWQRWEDD